jgi:hypothetical protein
MWDLLNHVCQNTNKVQVKQGDPKEARMTNGSLTHKDKFLARNEAIEHKSQV